MSTTIDGEMVGARYRSVRLRLTGLLGSLDADQWERPVPACPGWRVHDVLAHLLGNVEEALAGRISGPPTDEQTHEQVARHHDDDPAEMVERWNELAPQFEEVLDAFPIWPAFIDVVSHEHDLRAAVGDAGARDSGDVLLAATLVAQGLPDGIAVAIDGIDTGGGAAAPTAGAARVATSAFELLRIRLGRRSEAQVLAMAWEGDPRPHLDGIFVFGPSPLDQVE